MPLPPRDAEFLVRNRFTLVQDLQLEDGLYAAMRSKGLLNRLQDERLRAMPFGAHKGGALLDVLHAGDEDTVEKFLWCLEKTGQQPLVDYMRREAKKLCGDKEAVQHGASYFQTSEPSLKRSRDQASLEASSSVSHQLTSNTNVYSSIPTLHQILLRDLWLGLVSNISLKDDLPAALYTNGLTSSAQNRRLRNEFLDERKRIEDLLTDLEKKDETMLLRFVKSLQDANQYPVVNMIEKKANELGIPENQYKQ